MEVENNIQIVSSVVTKVWDQVQWLGNTIYKLSGNALGGGKNVMLKMASILKAIWGYMQPLLGRATGFLKSKVGLFATTMGAAAFCLNKSFSAKNPVHQVAFGVLGLGFAAASGVILTQAGMIPAFLA